MLYIKLLWSQSVCVAKTDDIICDDEVSTARKHASHVLAHTNQKIIHTRVPYIWAAPPCLYKLYHHQMYEYCPLHFLTHVYTLLFMYIRSQPYILVQSTMHKHVHTLLAACTWLQPCALVLSHMLKYVHMLLTDCTQPDQTICSGILLYAHTSLLHNRRRLPGG